MISSLFTALSLSLSPPARHFPALLAQQPVLRVRVASTEGAVPRGAGGWMAFFADAVAAQPLQALCAP